VIPFFLYFRVVSTMEKYYRTNRRRWNELVDVHVRSEEYNLEGFIGGESSLHNVELEALGDVSGKKLLHLQCHFGLDTLSWARLGAEVTGVDFSENAIQLARHLSEKLRIPARFIHCNVYDLPEVHNERYDIVYTSYGVINWLHDIYQWGEIVYHFLKSEGTFFIAEFHPFLWVFDEEGIDLVVKYSYWPTLEPQYFEVEGSYADKTAVLENKGNYEWVHPLSDVLNSLIRAGLTLQEIKEYPFSVDSIYASMEIGPDGYRRFKNKEYNLPIMFSVKAVKER
jgi:ubiquinone/menaquinone biosynthesis C-methylase UbiE